MNIFFDVDYTLICSHGTLRPGVKETFERLLDDGHAIHIWSGVGLRWYEVRHHSLESYIEGVYLKPTFNYHKEWERQAVGIIPDFVVDDHPEVARAFGGVVVRPYYFANPSDREMDGIYAAICSYVETGNTLHPRFFPPPANGKRANGHSG